MNDRLTPRGAQAVATGIVAVAAVNAADLTGVWDAPSPVPAALFALNTVLCVRWINHRRSVRRSTGGQ